jgi:50S ribosomal protein L16 3-hydroxylase
VTQLLREPHALACALGEVLSEPKRGVWFEPAALRAAAKYADLVLDSRTRMMYDDRHIFINGESFRATGRDAALMRSLADRRMLSAAQWRALSPAAREVVEGWLQAGWAARRCAHDGVTP